VQGRFFNPEASEIIYRLLLFLQLLASGHSLLYHRPNFNFIYLIFLAVLGFFVVLFFDGSGV
jgi:hypothetical protein